MNVKVKSQIRPVTPETVRILIVEDEMLTALAASMVLSELGYEIIGIAPTAEAALQSAAARRPDLVLMDITLRGEMDGIATADLLRERFGSPILYVTAHADEATMARAAASAPVGYLLKPYSAQQLGQAVAAACSAMRFLAPTDFGPSGSLRIATAG